MAKTPSSNIVRKAGSKAKSTKTSAQPGSAGHSPQSRAPPDWTKIAFANAPMASGSRRAGRTAENSRIGSALTTSFSATLSNAACGASAELTKRPTRTGSTGRRIVVDQGVTPTVKRPRSLDRTMPMVHCVEAMLLVLLDLGQAVWP